MTVLLVVKHRPAETKCVTSQEVGLLADVSPYALSCPDSDVCHSCYSADTSPGLYSSFLGREGSKVAPLVQKKMA